MILVSAQTHRALQPAEGNPYKRSRDGLQRQCEEQKAVIHQLEHRCKELHEMIQHRDKQVSAMDEALFSVW